MVDPNDTPTPANPPVPGRPTPSGKPSLLQDDALDESLEKALAPAQKELRPEAPLEAAVGCRARGGDGSRASRGLTREHLKSPAREAESQGQRGCRPARRGQEGRKGTATGKVISIRGKSMFVDLGGKSEGVIPLDQFEGGRSQRRARDRGHRRSLRPSEGVQHLAAQRGSDRGRTGTICARE